MNKPKLLLSLFVLVCLISCQSDPVVTPINLIPTPVDMQVKSGHFEINSATTVQLETGDEEVFRTDTCTSTKASASFITER